jgi:thiamine-phosphate pyrophosphorylase
MPAQGGVEGVSGPSCRRGGEAVTPGRLHVITDARPVGEVLPVVVAALRGGAPVVQLRTKTGTDRERYELASRVVELCDAHGATCVVDDRLDLALAVGAHGVHLGEHDLPVRVARRVLGVDRLLGATARDARSARWREDEGADYLGVGPVYATTTKDGLPDPIGVDGVRQVADAVSIPVVAIGGVTASRVGELCAAGAYGVAVVGAVSGADDPCAATRELMASLERVA